MSKRVDEHTAAVRAIARVSRLLERSCGELSLAHYRVLAGVAEGDERASRVAQRLALGKPTISASVDALCKRGLLEREDAVGDQRATTLRLTAEGAAVLRATERSMRDRLAAVLAYADSPNETAHALAELGAAVERLAAERFATR